MIYLKKVCLTDRLKNRKERKKEKKKEKTSCRPKTAKKENPNV